MRKKMFARKADEKEASVFDDGNKHELIYGQFFCGQADLQSTCPKKLKTLSICSTAANINGIP